MVYENPETSEVAEEYLTLAEALTHTPKPKAEIITNGTILAAAVGGVWGLTSAGSSWEEFPESARPRELRFTESFEKIINENRI